MEPTVGRIVLYKLSQNDISRLQQHPMAYQANNHHAGDVVPMTVVRPWHATGKYNKGVSVLNGQAFIDGPFTFWVLSASEGEGPGQWSWMEYQKGQAAKTEALEAQLDSIMTLESHVKGGAGDGGK